MTTSIPFLLAYNFLFRLLIVLILIYFFTLVANIIAKVPFVPTSGRIISYIAKLADLKKGEKVYDLGCGDGRFLIEAQKYTKTLAEGYENALLPFLLAKIRKFFNRAKIKVYMRNFLYADLSDANVIYCYLGPEIMPKLGEKFKKECRKGTRIYSNSFSIKNLAPKKIWEKDKKKRLPVVYYYQI